MKVEITNLKAPNDANEQVADATGVQVKLWIDKNDVDAPDVLESNASITDGTLTIPLDAVDSNIPITTGLQTALLPDTLSGANDTAVSTWEGSHGESNGTSPTGLEPRLAVGVTPSGHNALRFQESINANCKMHLPDSGTMGAATTFVLGTKAFDSEAARNRYYYLFARDSTTATRWYIKHIDQDGVTNRFRIGNSTRDVTSNKDWNVRAITADGTSKSAWINSVKVDTWTDPETGNVTNLTIGGPDDNSNQQIEGYIAAVLHYNRALTDVEMEEVSVWLKAKYIDGVFPASVGDPVLGVAKWTVTGDDYFFPIDTTVEEDV